MTPLAQAGDHCQGRCGRPLNVNEPVHRGPGGTVICAGCADAAGPVPAAPLRAGTVQHYTAKRGAGCDRCGAEPGTPCDVRKHDAHGIAFYEPGFKRVAPATQSTSALMHWAARWIAINGGPTDWIEELSERASLIERAGCINLPCCDVLQAIGEVRQ